MSPSGKVCDAFYDYETALDIFNKNKNLWKGWTKDIEHVSYAFSNDGGKTGKSGFIADKTFLEDCKPTKCWKVWYDESPCCIVDDYAIVECEIDNAKENDEIDKLHYEEIMMSEFERNFLPEFQGW
jgi:hypothetical protein